MNNLKDLQHLQNRYFALRHGQSMANVEGIILSNPADGIKGYGLSAEGKKQVTSAAGTWTHDSDDTIIISSDFLRARETAILFAENINCSNLLYDAKLQERFFGDFDRSGNSNYEEVWKHDSHNADHTLYNVESVNAVLARTTEVIITMEKKYTDKMIVLVSHGDSLQILQTGFYKIDPAKHRQLEHLKTAELRELVLSR